MTEPAGSVGPDDLVVVAPGTVVPVVAGGRVIGVVTAAAPGPAVAYRVMVPLRRDDILSEDESLATALERIARTGRPVVVTSGGRMVGAVLPERLAAWADRTSSREESA
jgi:hypothetical protein